MSSGHTVPDLRPDLEEFEREVHEGLRKSPKRIPCKFFYDEEGSRLFDRITELPEYYPTRTELEILDDNLPEISERLGARCLVVEYGSGSSEKTYHLLNHLVNPAGYVPIDISREHLLKAAARLREVFPRIPILPVAADYTDEITVPVGPVPPRRTVVFFPGSTIGNFTPSFARTFLARARREAGAGGGLLIGVDLKKDRETLERAYDDREGVTAAFNRNLLVRINRELDADFDLDAFRHFAWYNERASRIEMHLVSLRRQSVTVGEETFSFHEGETIWTESSYKYDLPEFAELAASVGFVSEKIWVDSRKRFSLQLFRVGS